LSNVLFAFLAILLGLHENPEPLGEVLPRYNLRERDFLRVVESLSAEYAIPPTVDPCMETGFLGLALP
jgi:hypothetical protein